jgi:hypothetical protein
MKFNIIAATLMLIVSGASYGAAGAEGNMKLEGKHTYTGRGYTCYYVVDQAEPICRWFPGYDETANDAARERCAKDGVDCPPWMINPFSK